MLIDGKEVLYEIRPSRRARRLGLTVYPGGRLVLTVPEKATGAMVERFIHTHTAWIARNLKRFANKKRLPGGMRDYRENHEKALALIQARVRFLNLHYNFRFGRITVRNNRSRWGSCTRKGDLNFNYKLVYLPGELRDYIIVHELCHLAYFDHSSLFWKKVAETIPNHKVLRRTLRANLL